MVGEARTRTGNVRRGAGPRGEAVSAAAGPFGAPPAILADRYVLGDRLGAGGMGVVYEAHDRQLDRRLAIKLLHRGASAGHARRLLREAQTLARLSHPNLVPVFDVGRAGSEVFVAMELVSGQSLDRYAAGRPVPWRRALPLLLDAGRGLAHAHRCGLVHRDFKPSNVLVGDDGRARVADFGLARSIAAPSWEREPSSESSGDPNDRAAALTRPGETPGTPAYMPPELRRGAAFDERGDQFSFCVTAWEVLFGQRPHRDPDSGAVTPTPALAQARTGGAAAVPRSIRRALLRGMQTDPALRHPSMEALLHALERHPRRWWSVGLGAGALGLALGVGVFGELAATTACDEVDRSVHDRWNDEMRSRTLRNLVAAQIVDADGVHASISAGLDAHVAAVSALRRDACVAHHIEHRESDALFDRRMRCLDEREEVLGGVVDILAQTDRREVLLAGPAAVSGLPSVMPCADAQGLLAVAWQPRSEDERAALRRLFLELGHVQSLVDTGQVVVAMPEADALLRHSEVLPDSPVRAQAQVLWASLRRRNGDDDAAVRGLEAAATTAAAARDDQTLAIAWLEVVSVLASKPDREREFDTAAAMVEALIGRLGSPVVMRAKLLDARGRMAASAARFDDAVALATSAFDLVTEAELDDPLLRARFAGNVGLHLKLAGRYDEAADYFERAIALSSAVLTPTHPQIGTELVNLSLFQAPLQAEASLRRATAILEAAFPEGHADVAFALSNLGLVLLNRGAYDEAESSLLRALEIHRRVYPDGHHHTSMTLGFLADLLNEVGRRREAIRYANEALEMRRRHLAPEHPDIGRALRLLGSIYFDAGDRVVARGYYEEALAAFERGLPPDHPLIAGALNGIGECAVLDHDAERALEVCSRALEIERAARGEDSPDLVPHLSCIASAYDDEGEPERAIPMLERALALWSEVDVGPLLTAQIELQLAASLDHAGQDPERVAALARGVLEAIATEPEARVRMVEQAQNLLAGAAPPPR